MTIQNYCQQLNQAFDDFKKKVFDYNLDGLQNDFQQTLNDGRFAATFEDIDDQKRKFTEEYQTQAKNVLDMWYQNLFPHAIAGRFPLRIRFEDDQRVAIDGSLEIESEGTILKYFPQLIRKVVGRIKIDQKVGTFSVPLDFLEEAGDLLIAYTKINSLKRLKRVEGHFYISGCNELDDLPSLEYIGENFTAVECSTLKSVKNLKHIGGDGFLQNVGNGQLGMTRFDNLTTVDGQFYANFNQKISFPSLKKAGTIRLDANYYAHMKFAEVFPALEEVGEEDGVSIAVYPEMKEEVENLPIKRKGRVKATDEGRL